jgi:hypothetical protein
MGMDLYRTFGLPGTMVVDYCQEGHGDDNGQYDEESSGRGTTAGTVFAG